MPGLVLMGKVVLVQKRSDTSKNSPFYGQTRLAPVKTVCNSAIENCFHMLY